MTRRLLFFSLSQRPPRQNLTPNDILNVRGVV